MTTINDILTLDLSEDIKHVIDIEDRSENEIQAEIESYIVTEGIDKHLNDFINQFTSNIKETGVWISGFYGSGKSYFGKMLGYLITNPMINGTPARERFIPRLRGVSNESLIENAILSLTSINGRAVFLDIAKQNTDKGFAFTLFTNLLKNLGFRDDLYGYMEFELLLDGKYDEFKAKVKDIEGKNWDELKRSNRQVAKAMRSAYYAMGYSEADYSETLEVYKSAVDGYSASRFKGDLERYLKFNEDEIIVLIFDEASEAISQEKITLLDLEGISEALSGINSKVWTVAIAQEKLDDVINNANIKRAQLIKVTDRFKTKIHIESTEVDVIIRSRLLQKREGYTDQLIGFYNKNEGLISDATNLKSSFPTKTTSADQFATYYPFHRYQFDVLQKFLFSSNALVATQVAARGMIITTFEVLRKQMREHDLYAFTPGFAICTEAQTAPPVGLVNKYDTANKTLNDKNLGLDGEELLKTIHLLSESEIVSANVENITKSYISDIKTYYEIKPKVEEALKLLEETKVLLATNNNYKITSDLEGRMLEEMNDFSVELFSKKRFLINHLKEIKLFIPVATYNDGTDSFKFNVLSDQDDELSPGNKELRLTVYSLFNISDNRQDFVEQVKLETQSDKDVITLIPDNREFSQIDKIIGDVSRYKYMEEKYANESDSEKRQIVRDFAIIREEKEKELRVKFEKAYQNASIVYLFDEHLLNADTFKATISETQRKLVKNIYTKRLATQLSEGLVSKIFNNRKENLHGLFSGDDFKFFDSHGNFIGENLKVVEEISSKISTRFVDGRTLESELSGPPWGYSFGTIVTTLAALFRGGRLSVKYDGETWFSYDQIHVQGAFSNATRFKSASFKSISKTLTASQKNQAVELLLDLEIQSHIGRKVDWNINDFDLADAIQNFAEHFLGSLTTLNDTVDNFDALFPNVAAQKSVLQEYSGKTTEGNYIEKVEYLLDTKEAFRSSIQTILKAQKFIKKNFSRVRDYQRFVEEVIAELKKSDRSDQEIQDAADEFNRLYQEDMVSNFGQLEQKVQIVKDSYYRLLENAADGMTHQYRMLEGKVDTALRDLKKKYPEELNQHNLRKLEDLKRYCSDRVVPEPTIDFSITDNNSGFSLSDMLNYSALVPSKETDLTIIQSSFVLRAGPDPDSDLGSATMAPKRKIQMSFPNKVMSAGKYKALLAAHLQKLAGANDDDEIEVDIEGQ